MSELVFTYRHDPSFFDKTLSRDDFGYLTMAVSTKQFSGRGGFWVQWQDVKEFGESLDVYPIVPGAPLKAEWGLESQKVYYPILGVQIGAANATGDLLVQVEIADDHYLRDRVQASFQTNYPDLEAFRMSIAQLMKGDATQAVLTGR